MLSLKSTGFILRGAGMKKNIYLQCWQVRLFCVQHLASRWRQSEGRCISRIISLRLLGTMNIQRNFSGNHCGRALDHVIMWWDSFISLLLSPGFRLSHQAARLVKIWSQAGGSRQRLPPPAAHRPSLPPGLPHPPGEAHLRLRREGGQGRTWNPEQ